MRRLDDHRTLYDYGQCGRDAARCAELWGTSENGALKRIRNAKSRLPAEEVEALLAGTKPERPKLPDLPNPFRESDVTPELVERLREAHGDLCTAAKALVPTTVGHYGQKVAWRTIYSWLTSRTTHPILERSPGPGNTYSDEDVNRLRKLLDDAGIAIEAIKNVDQVKLKSWGVAAKIKDADGNERIATEALYATTLVLNPLWESGPAWPIVQPAAPTKIEYRPPTIIVPKGLRVEVVLPDTQFGYTRDLDSRRMVGHKESHDLLPIHDEAALDVSEQIVAAVQPDGVTHVGDLMDFSEFSRYLQVEEFFRTTQASIDRGHLYLARIAAAMGERRKGRPQKRRRLVSGNHDEKRLGSYLQQNARAAYRLRPAMATPASWPLMTLPQLLRLDEIGWEFMGSWPGSEAWLVEGDNGLVVIHDPQKRGMFQANVIAGHTHHHRVEAFTVRTPFGHRTFSLYEIGCLCSLKRVADTVAIQRTRTPSDRGWVSGWVQGVAVVEILQATGAHQLQFVQINEGRAIYGGQVFQARKKAA